MQPTNLHKLIFQRFSLTALLPARYTLYGSLISIRIVKGENAMRKSSLATVSIFAFAALFAARQASAQTYNLDANLDPFQEVPPHNTPGYGSADLTLDATADTVTINAGTASTPICSPAPPRSAFRTPPSAPMVRPSCCLPLTPPATPPAPSAAAECSLRGPSPT